jgi:hypothetical protein
MAAGVAAFFAEEEWAERIWAAAVGIERHFLSFAHRAHLAFVDLHAIGPQAVALGYERLMAFALLFEEAYGLRAGCEPPRASSEALALAMFEFGYRETPTYGRRTPPRLLPQRVYLCLAPFLGPEEATELVEHKLGQAGALE